jgi:hypothetical protein
MKADRQATEARHFISPKSYVAKDGREILFREDWLARKLELWARCKGRCEYKYLAGNTWVRCNAEAVIPSHVEPRHPHRDDRLENLKAHCFVHDRLTEKQAWRKTRFGEKTDANQ